MRSQVFPEILLACLASLVLANVAVGGEMKWKTLPIVHEHKAVTACGRMAAVRACWARCKGWAESRNSESDLYRIMDVKVLNFDRESGKKKDGATWIMWCKYRCGCKCGYKIFVEK